MATFYEYVDEQGRKRVVIDKKPGERVVLNTLNPNVKKSVSDDRKNIGDAYNSSFFLKEARRLRNKGYSEAQVQAELQQYRDYNESQRKKRNAENVRKAYEEEKSGYSAEQANRERTQAQANATYGVVKEGTQLVKTSETRNTASLLYSAKFAEKAGQARQFQEQPLRSGTQLSQYTSAKGDKSPVMSSGFIEKRKSLGLYSGTFPSDAAMAIDNERARKYQESQKQKEPKPLSSNKTLAGFQKAGRGVTYGVGLVGRGAVRVLEGAVSPFLQIGGEALSMTGANIGQGYVYNEATGKRKAAPVAAVVKSDIPAPKNFLETSVDVAGSLAGGAAGFQAASSPGLRTVEPLPNLPKGKGIKIKTEGFQTEEGFLARTSGKIGNKPVSGDIIGKTDKYSGSYSIGGKDYNIKYADGLVDVQQVKATAGGLKKIGFERTYRVDEPYLVGKQSLSNRRSDVIFQKAVPNDGTYYGAAQSDTIVTSKISRSGRATISSGSVTDSLTLRKGRVTPEIRRTTTGVYDPFTGTYKTSTTSGKSYANIRFGRTKPGTDYDFIKTDLVKGEGYVTESITRPKEYGRTTPLKEITRFRKITEQQSRFEQFSRNKRGETGLVNRARVDSGLQPTFEISFSNPTRLKTPNIPNYFGSSPGGLGLRPPLSVKSFSERSTKPVTGITSINKIDIFGSPKIKPLYSSRISVGGLSKVSIGVGSGVTTGNKIDVLKISDTSQRTSSITKQYSVPKTNEYFKIPVYKDPFIFKEPPITPPPPVPFIPFRFGGGFGSGGGSGSKTKNKTRYAPSLTAAALGIKGKRNRADTLTGIGIRPL